MILKDLLNSDGSINQTKCIKFNKDVLFKYDDKNVIQCSKPSYELSKSINLKVYQEYNLPYKWDSDDLEYITIVCRKEEKLISELFDLLLDLNPGIDNLYNTSTSTKGNTYYKYDILLGMGSLFNLDDIMEFINGGVGIVKRQDSEYTAKLQFIESEIQNYVQYVPSYKTLNIVFNHLFKP